MKSIPREHPHKFIITIYEWNIEMKINITTQSVASPHTPHLLMIPIATFAFELWHLQNQ